MKEKARFLKRCMIAIWELDFYSRPILDENQKKVWEVLVCESALDTGAKEDFLFRYSKFCPASEVNSAWLRAALAEAIAQAPQPPKKIRFFRRFMSNMITKACTELGIPAQPSRRTLALNRWLQQRMTEVYPTMPGFQNIAPNPSVQGESSPAQPLPDALIGQQWAFVTLEASAFAEMSDWEIEFKEAFPLEMVGNLKESAIAPDTLIPGMIIFSPRAIPLAGWMSGLDLASVKFEADNQPRLILETGVSDRWILANIRDPKTLDEAKNFEQVKKKAQGAHFLAVQSDPNSESFAGFWLLPELDIT